MLVVVITVYLALVFPLFLNFNGYYATDKEKVFFCFDLFGFIKIISGYAQLYSDGIGIHLSNKKAIIIPYYSVLGLRKKVKPLKDYHVIRADFLTEFSCQNDPIYPVTISFLIGFFANIVGVHLKNVKPYVKTNVTSLVNVNRDFSDFSLNFTVLLNLLMVVISLIKMLVEKIIYESRKRKQNKYGG